MLLRDSEAREAINALDAADKRVVERREKAKSDEHREELDEWSKERGLKTPQDHINYIQKKVLKSQGTGTLMSTLELEYPRCTCGAACIRIYDTEKSTPAKIVWLDKVKCVSCGKIHTNKL